MPQARCWLVCVGVLMLQSVHALDLDCYGTSVSLLMSDTQHPERAIVAARVGSQEPPASERAALLALYEATDGPNWGRDGGWATNRSVCEWHGVQCDDARSHVV